MPASNQIQAYNLAVLVGGWLLLAGVFCCLFALVPPIIISFVFATTFLRLAIEGQTVSNAALAAICFIIGLRLGAHLLYLVVALVTNRFDRESETVNGLKISRQSNPHIMSLVAEVGGELETRLPDEVWILPWAECYALEQRRLGISRDDRRLVLAVGLPLIEILTNSEMKVILAHELAHFSGGETRSRVFIFRFLAALRGVIYEHVLGPGRFLDPVYWFVQVLHPVVVALAQPHQKQQEYRADALAAELLGSEISIHTLLKTWLISNQFDAIAASYDPQSQGDNLYQHFAQSWSEFSQQGHAYLRNRLAELERDVQEDHPTITQRIAALEKLAQPDQAAGSQRVVNMLQDRDSLERELQQMLFSSFPTAADDEHSLETV